MDTSSYIILSKQTALFRQMDIVANNIANANSAGFQAQNVLFSEYMTKGSTGEMNRPVSFMQDLATVRDTTPGALMETGHQLDAAIKGKGYFVVDTPLGKRFTRVGNFKIDSEGQLTTPEGYILQGDGGPIVLDENDSRIVIREDGTVASIVQGGIQEERGKLSVVTFGKENNLKMAGGNFFSSDEEPQIANELDYKVAQGTIEGSNVNSVTELTNMIKVNRAVGLTAKFLSDTNDLQRRAISVLGRVN